MSESGYIHGTAKTEQERLALLNRLTNAQFLEFLELEDDERILEVGSGLGILTAEVASRVRGAVVIGIEYSTNQVEAIQGRKVDVSYVQGDAQALPFDDDAFDLIYCRFLLEHVPSPESVLAETRRVLRPNGRLFSQENNILAHVCDPDCPLFARLWREFAALQKILGGDALIGARLYSLLRHAGFRDVEISMQPEMHWAGEPSFRAWIDNLIGNLHGAADALISHELASKDDIEAACDELREFATREDASTIFYWNQAKAVK